MKPSDQTRGQLERTLSQRIEAFYFDELGHRPSKVTCHIFGQQIALLLEEAITQPEQILSRVGQDELAEQVRTDLDKAMRPQMIQLIEEVVGVPVTDVLSDATLETGRTGTIIVLAESPQLRETGTSSRLKKQKVTNSSSDEP